MLRTFQDTLRQTKILKDFERLSNFKLFFSSVQLGTELCSSGFGLFFLIFSWQLGIFCAAGVTSGVCGIVLAALATVVVTVAVGTVGGVQPGRSRNPTTPIFAAIANGLGMSQNLVPGNFLQKISS